MSQGLFSKLYEAGQPFALIDTRERREHVAGHWFGSTNVPLSVLTTSVSRLIPQQDFPVYLLDWQDTASAVAAGQLEQMGYSQVTSCRTSKPDQFGNGFVKGEYVWSKAFGEVVAHTSNLPEVTPAEYLASYKDARLFDVRPTAEYAQFTIPRSQSLPNSLLLANMQALKATQGLALLHCAGRTRSIIGACTLKAAGYEGAFAIFKGGTQAWQLDGLEREFNADRLFATESSNPTSAMEFLRQWKIDLIKLNNHELHEFINQHNSHHLFDVSNDAATGDVTAHGIIKISGTNLIQQTDRSIARYHVPVVLFDDGSGSRAAFAAYWLYTMGYSVSVVLLNDQLPDAKPGKQSPATPDHTLRVFNSEQLIEFCDTANGRIFDCRASQDFNRGHLKHSEWHNISELLRQPAARAPITIIGNSETHAVETADILAQQQWIIAGVFGWHD
ncbi:MAG: rhodanese-like domain-containing protein, partial [Pseudomonadota bacterium]